MFTYSLGDDEVLVVFILRFFAALLLSHRLLLPLLGKAGLTLHRWFSMKF